MTAWVLMTALPPTRGHANLIRFARGLDYTTVILSTQPHEPMVSEREEAISSFCRTIGVSVEHFTDPIQQEPKDGNDKNFWRMWKDRLVKAGLREGDYIVGSELYCAKLAEVCGCIFMPYDIPREIYHSKATQVREHLLAFFPTVMPEFQHWIQMRTTIFGAESTGKTTLSKSLAWDQNGLWLPEWARPYLEQVGPEVTPAKMERIWHGQAALQSHATAEDMGFIVQDTDLFSTLGYWEFWNHPGAAPKGLLAEAHGLKSDLYLLTPSNIPFEPDPLRYGGDHREADDQYWIHLLDREGLNYRILQSSDPQQRIAEASEIIESEYERLFASRLRYTREGTEYE